MPYNVEFQSSVFPEECRITKTKFDPRKWHLMTKKMGIVIYQISVCAESRGHVLVLQFSSSFEILVIW